MAERTEQRALPVKKRAGLIVSGIFDIVFAFLAMVATLVMYDGYDFYDSLLNIVFLYFAVLCCTLAFGIVTITLYGKTPEEFKPKKKLLVTSLIFISVALFFSLIGTTFEVDDAFLGLLLLGLPIASIVFKSLSLKRKEFVTVTVVDDTAPAPANDFVAPAPTVSVPAASREQTAKRPMLVVSGIFDIIASLPALYFATVAAFMILAFTSGAFYTLYFGTLALVIFACAALPLVFGIITLTLCKKSSEEFRKKRKLLITSLVFTSIRAFAGCIFFLAALDSYGYMSAGEFLLLFLVTAMPIASIVFKSVALKKKEVAAEVGAPTLGPVVPPAALPDSELRGYQLMRQRGEISAAEYEAKRIEIASRGSGREDELKKLRIEFVDGNITVEEYERRRKLIENAEKPEPESPGVFS